MVDRGLLSVIYLFILYIYLFICIYIFIFVALSSKIVKRLFSGCVTRYGQQFRSDLDIKFSIISGTLIFVFLDQPVH